MIWGLTFDQEYARYSALAIKRQTPHTWFAWFPVCFYDGRVAWLENVVRQEKWVYGSGHKWTYNEVIK